MNVINQKALLKSHAGLLKVLKDLMSMRGRCYIPNTGDWWDEAAEKAIKDAEEFHD